jgi:protein N-lysine methyltransferase METTL21D
VATDLPDVINSVLANNISKNLANLPRGSGTVQIRALDWCVSPLEWTWEHHAVIASSAPVLAPAEDNSHLLTPPFDLIVTADTVYSPHLVDPLLRTLTHLFMISVARVHSGKLRHPCLYICIERRDPTLVDEFLTAARLLFTVTRVPQRKVSEALGKHGLMWSKEDWEGMEIWSFTRSCHRSETS